LELEGKEEMNRGKRGGRGKREETERGKISERERERERKISGFFANFFQFSAGILVTFLKSVFPYLNHPL